MSWSLGLKICTLSFRNIWDGNIHCIHIYFFFFLLLQFPSKESIEGVESHEILLSEIDSLPAPNVFFSVPFTLKLVEYTDHIKGLRSFSNRPFPEGHWIFSLTNLPCAKTGWTAQLRMTLRVCLWTHQWPFQQKQGHLVSASFSYPSLLSSLFLYHTQPWPENVSQCVRR